MEDSKPPPSTSPAQTLNPNPIPNPPSTVQNLPPLPPQKNQKRALDDNGHMENSNYFKMRAVLKDLRPHFVEVLRTPVFHNCKAAHEIQEQMKLLMDLYKEMTAETIFIGKCKNMPENPLSSEIQDGPKTREHQQDIKPVEQPPAAERAFVKASEEKPVLLGNLSGKPNQGTYIVGGSAFGWNFITFPGNKAVYYGRTKEMFRTANVIPQ